MAYTTSKSKKIALERTREAYNNVVLLESIRVMPRVPNISSIQQMTFQSAIVIACASLEQYLVSFFDDWFIVLQQNKGTFKNVPNSLRTYFLMKQQYAYMRNLVANGDEHKYIIATDISKDYYKVHNSNRLVKGVVDFRDFKFYNKDSFPTEDNIKKMFSIIGLPSIFKELARHGRRINLRWLLESFLDVRNAIAHRQSPDLTIQDMNEHFRTIRLLIRILDRILYAHLCQVSGENFWPKSR